MAVYLIHLHESISEKRNCQHYIGFANDVEARISYHRKGQSRVRIFEIAKEKNISFDVVRVWQDGTKAFERRLKEKGNYKRLCPVCTPIKAILFE